jgi:phytoene dehydrogenase-like protein
LFPVFLLENIGMAVSHVIGALREKRAELAGSVRQMEQQLAQHRSNLAHLDATMRLFDPGIHPDENRSRRATHRNAWFRPGECLRLIYDELREASEPLPTRDIAERIIGRRALKPDDERSRDLIQRTILSSLNRAGTTITRLQRDGIVCWQLAQGA